MTTAGARAGSLDRWRRALGLACLALASGAASASGDPGPYDEFAARLRTDIELQAYADGQLGVLLPTYDRVYLYPAWRSIMLGHAGLAKHPTAPGSMSRAVGYFVEGWWIDPKDLKQPGGRWIAASDGVQHQQEQGDRGLGIAKTNADFSSYLNCPPAAFTFAVETLQRLQKQPDATPQRLADWVQAQREVFTFCAYSPAAPQGSYASKQSAIPPQMPEPLASSEPLPWRQMREYQIAAAHFYRGDLEESARGFTAVGATPGHPMQGWGAYLALRAHARMATLQPQPKLKPGADNSGPSDRPELYAPLAEEAQRILDDASLAAVHSDTRATLRTLQYRLMPRQRFEALSALLDEPNADPNIDDHFGDWSRLADDSFDGWGLEGEAARDRSMRAHHAYFDWMRTLAPLCQANRVNPDCSKEAGADHALEAWAHPSATHRAQEPGLRRAWLVASLMTATKLPASLEQTALAVPRTAPEYLTVRYNLARLYRLGAEADKARSMAESGLAEASALAPASRSASNLFRQERFADATSLADGARYLERERVAFRNRITGEVIDNPRDRNGPAADGLALLNGKLAIKDLLLLAHDERLDPQTRSRVAIAAWLRADILRDRVQAEAAALAVQKTTPALKPVTEHYLRLKVLAERRHWLLVNALRYQLATTVSNRSYRGLTWDAALPEVRQEDVLAGMWCSAVERNGGDYNDSFDIERSIAPPDLSTDVAARDREIAALKRVKTATGFVADDVFGWARSHPDDPDLPWLLHVVVLSTRGGCLDANASRTSRAAFMLLHSGRYKNSEWAQQTHVWY